MTMKKNIGVQKGVLDVIWANHRLRPGCFGQTGPWGQLARTAPWFGISYGIEVKQHLAGSHKRDVYLVSFKI
jgi:hypothetical protein